MSRRIGLEESFLFCCPRDSLFFLSLYIHLYTLEGSVRLMIVFGGGVAQRWGILRPLRLGKTAIYLCSVLWLCVHLMTALWNHETGT